MFNIFKYGHVHRNKEGVAANADEIEKLKRICKELEDKAEEQEATVSDLNARLESTIVNIGLNNKTTRQQLHDRKLQIGAPNLPPVNIFAF